MAVSYQNTTITGISYQSTNISQGYFGSTLVFSSSGSDLILDYFHLETDVSVIPRPAGVWDTPYTNNDPSASAPEKTATDYISLGDITSYDGVTFNWNNDGSYNSYGSIYCDISVVDMENIEVEGTKVRLYTTLQGFGYKTINLQSLSGSYKLKVVLYAKSFSNYSGYSSKATVTLSAISGVIGGIVPPLARRVTPDFSMISSISAPGPYDENNYNYNWSGGTDTDTITVDLGDVTDSNELVFEWASMSDEVGTSIGFGGEAKASYTNMSNTEVNMFSINTAGTHINNGRVVIDLTGVTGQKSITFKTTAYGCNPYRYYGTTTRLTIMDMFIY